MRYKFHHIALTLLLFQSVPELAYAAEQFDMLTSGFRMLVGLLIVLGLIFLLQAILRKKMAPFAGTGSGTINVVEVKHIMPRKTLILVEIRGKEFIVGASSNTIDAIVPLEKGTPPEANTEAKAELSNSENQEPLR